MSGKLFVLCGDKDAITKVAAWSMRWALYLGCNPENVRVLELQNEPTDQEVCEMRDAIPEWLTILALLPVAHQVTAPTMFEFVGHLSEAADVVAVVRSWPMDRYHVKVLKDRNGMMPATMTVRA